MYFLPKSFSFRFLLEQKNRQGLTRVRAKVFEFPPKLPLSVFFEKDKNHGKIEGLSVECLYMSSLNLLFIRGYRINLSSSSGIVYFLSRPGFPLTGLFNFFPQPVDLADSWDGRQNKWGRFLIFETTKKENFLIFFFFFEVAFEAQNRVINPGFVKVGLMNSQVFWFAQWTG